MFEAVGTPLHANVVRSDKLTQYGCRQNFMKVASASVVEHHPNSQMIHWLAVVDQFKGNNHAVGKDSARAIWTMELSGKHTATTNDVFVNC
jgi:hypothetical protein